MESESPKTQNLAVRVVAFLAAFVLTALGAFLVSAPILYVERWAGFLVLGLLTAIFIVLYLRDWVPFGHPSAYALGLIAAALLLIPAAFVAQFFEAGFDDGPFHGRPFTGDVTALETSHKALFRSGELVIYNRTDEETPMLAYLIEGTAEWALEMDVTENPDYSDAGFWSVSQPVSVSYGIVRDRLDFVAHWSGGAEHGYVFIWKFGSVQRFYLSW